MSFAGRSFNIIVVSFAPIYYPRGSRNEKEGEEIDARKTHELTTYNAVYGDYYELSEQTGHFPVFHNFKAVASKLNRYIEI